MKKDFITVTPDTGEGGSQQVQVTADTNPTYQSRETTINFNANGQVVKSVKAVQDGIPFATALGLTCNSSQKSMIDIAGFRRVSSYNNAPMFFGNVTKNIYMSPSSFLFSILVGGLVSWYDETQDDELIAEFTWTTNTGAEIESNYATFTFDNEDGEDWKNYTCTPSMSEITPGADNNPATVTIKIGHGRGDTGLDEDTN